MTSAPPPGEVSNTPDYPPIAEDVREALALFDRSVAEGAICPEAGLAGRLACILSSQQRVWQEGQGRADRLRAYTVTVTRMSDGQSRSRFLGPGYHTKNQWQQARDRAFRELLKELR